MLRRRLGARIPVLLLLGAIATLRGSGCTDVTINSTPQGTEAVASSPATGPVLIDKEGVHYPPTATPGPYEPVYPITPPPPTSTPRRG